MNNVNKVLELLNASYSNYHAVKNICTVLEEKGFKELKENEKWNLDFNQKYFVKRNNTSVMAFTTPKSINQYGMNICASHSDSPTFKVKPNSVIDDKQYVKLNTEVYGGPIFSTWLDKPLSLAGRVLVNENGKVQTKLINIDKNLLVIPNIAPHMKPEVAKGCALNAQVDMLPLIGMSNGENVSVEKILSSYLDNSDIIDYDLTLVNRQKSELLGLNDEFIISPRLDDLAAAYTSLLGFIDNNNKESMNIYLCFDNEEVGSSTRQGAGSTFLVDVLDRVFDNLGYNVEDRKIIYASSFMLSCDNAHASHPNLAQYFDSNNRTYPNKGVVLKYNANENYTTSGLSAAYVKTLAKNNNLNIQTFVNRSDVRGGGTLGHILNGQLSILSADIGLSQLAMHSSTEVCGKNDIDDMILLTKAFYNNKLINDSDSTLEF